MDQDVVGPLFGNLFKTLASALKSGERLNVRQPGQLGDSDLSPTEQLMNNAVSNSAPIRAQMEKVRICPYLSVLNQSRLIFAGHHG
jgi:hypothetical protein